MYDSIQYLEEEALKFLIQYHLSLSNITKNSADYTCLEYVQLKSNFFFKRDLITAGTMINILVDNGYLDSNIVSKQGLVLTISEKGNNYILKNHS